MTALPASGAFTMVDQAHVAAVGPSAALLFARICWRTEQADSWSASIRQLSIETGLPERAVRTAAAVLRDREWIATEQTGGYDRTTVWQPLLAGQVHGAVSVTCIHPESADGSAGNVTIDAPESAISSTQTEDLTTDTPAAPAAVLDTPATEETPMPVPVSYQEPLLPAVGLALVPDPPEPAGPPKTAQTLVARWCDGYRTSHGGKDAAGPVMKRVAGQMRNLAKACGESHTDWVAAYAAAYQTGEQGRTDPVTVMAGVQRQATGRRNVWIDPALGGPGVGAVGSMAAFLTSGTPRAIGAPE